MHVKPPPESWELAQAIRAQMGAATYTLAELHTAIETIKHKPIRIREVLIHHAYLGLCFAFRNCHLILLTPGLSKTLAAATYLHELLHIYRGDAQMLDLDYDESVPDLIISHAMHRRDADQAYNQLAANTWNVEQIVEGATFILLGDLADDDIVPPMVRMMYSDPPSFVNEKQRRGGCSLPTL